MMIVDIPLITRRTARGGRHRPPKNSRLDVLSRQIDDDDRIIPYCAPHFSGQKTAIEVMVRPDEGTRTPNSACVWIAEATVDGRVYTARSRHGATNELARQLAAAGLADRPMVIRCRGLAGTLSYRSFHAAAKWTYKEGDRPLRRVRYKERPEGVFLGIRTGPKCVSSAVDDDVEVPPAEGHETEAPAPTAEMRRCDGCGGDFQSARPWSRFCSPACRLRAHRRLARDTRTQKPATISESAFP